MQAQTVRTSTGKGYKGQAMEGMIASWYAKNTRSEAGHREWAEKLAGLLPAGSRVLEVAPGPGYLSIELSRRGDFHVTGLDISHSFVEIAQKNARTAGVSVDFRQGNASDMPFDANTFDFIVCRSAFKNFSEPEKALAEFQRVLRPGGKALILDLRRDAKPQDIDALVHTMGLSRLNAWITRWTFANMLLKRAYTPAEIIAMLPQTGFRKYEIPERPVEMEVWLEKESMYSS